MTQADPLELTNGTWRPAGGIMRWFPDPDVMTTAEWNRVANPDVFDPHEPACPCGATVTTTCRSKAGHRTKDHSGRKPRVCICGGHVAWKKRVCDDCRRATELAGKRAWHERRAA